MAVAMPLGPGDVVHQGWLCTCLPISNEHLLAPPGMASALCLCYWFHWCASHGSLHDSSSASHGSFPGAGWYKCWGFPWAGRALGCSLCTIFCPQLEAAHAGDGQLNLFSSLTFRASLYPCSSGSGTLPLHFVPPLQQAGLSIWHPR